MYVCYAGDRQTREDFASAARLLQFRGGGG